MIGDPSVKKMSREEIVDEFDMCVSDYHRVMDRLRELIDGVKKLGILDELKGDLYDAGLEFDEEEGAICVRG